MHLHINIDLTKDEQWAFGTIPEDLRKILSNQISELVADTKQKIDIALQTTMKVAEERAVREGATLATPVRSNIIALPSRELVVARPNA